MYIQYNETWKTEQEMAETHTRQAKNLHPYSVILYVYLLFFFFHFFFISSWHPTLDLILFFLNRHNTQVYIWYNIATFLFFIFFSCWCLCCCVLFDEDKKNLKKKNINSPVKHHTRRALAISSRHTIICFLWVLYTICFLFFRFFLFPHKIPFYSLSFWTMFFFLSFLYNIRI